MQNKARPMKVLMYQSAGFLAIIALSWVNESAGLWSLILGNNPYVSDYRQSTLQMLLVLAVWLLVARSTGRVLARLRYLESFMRVCAWCRRIEHKGQWVHFEEFLKEGFDTPTSHGICDECLEKEKAAMDRAKALTSQPSAQGPMPA